MSISVERNVVDQTVGLYVPFRTAQRGGVDGGDPVGTLSINAEVTGDGTAGTVQIEVVMQKLAFGFHPLWLVTDLTLTDAGAAQVVIAVFDSRGNERLIGDLSQVGSSVAGPFTTSIFKATGNGVIIEPSSLLVATGAHEVMQGLWTTNTNGNIYHVHAFGYVYDAEILARSGRLAGLLGGLT